MELVLLVVTGWVMYQAVTKAARSDVERLASEVKTLNKRLTSVEQHLRWRSQ